MFRKISTVLLSFLLVWYAAAQNQEEKPKETKAEGITVYAPLHEEVFGEDGEEIFGQVRLTAALRSLSQGNSVRVDFVLKSGTDTYRQSVEINEDCMDERDFYCATAVFSNLKSGVYTASVEQAEGADLDYIISNNRETSQYVLSRDKVTFEIHHAARLSSAEFLMKEMKNV